MKIIKLVLCILFMATPTWAGPLIDSGSGDIRLQLPSTDGSDSVVVEDSSGADMATVDSDGNGTFVTSDHGIVVNLSTTATVTVSGNRANYVNNDDDVIEFDLPADPENCFFCFLNRYAQVITIDPDDADYIILEGTTADAGEAIVSSGAAGEFICLFGLDSEYWFSMESDSASSWAEASP